jgi:hypothetical protein
MQFVIIGLDGTDDEAPARRQAVRQDHIAMVLGHFGYGVKRKRSASIFTNLLRKVR